MDEIFERISFGIGRNDGRAGDHPVIDEIRDAAFAPQRALRDLAAKQLGTVGAGNHYVDLFADEQDRVWIGVHFGSRGFGHKTASGFLALAQGLPFDARASEGEMDAPPTLLHVDSELGAGYIAAMQLAGRYAYAGRDVVCDGGAAASSAPRRSTRSTTTTTSPGARSTTASASWVVRKGATPAFPGQRGFVGATMGEPAVILEGVESDARARARCTRPSTAPAARCRARRRPAGSAGAGPAHRDCDWVQPPHTPQARRLPAVRHGSLSRSAGCRCRAGAIDFADGPARARRPGHRAARRRRRRGAGRLQAAVRGSRAVVLGGQVGRVQAETARAAAA